jgi:hypothetical protein
VRLGDPLYTYVYYIAPIWQGFLLLLGGGGGGGEKAFL